MNLYAALTFVVWRLDRGFRYRGEQRGEVWDTEVSRGVWGVDVSREEGVEVSRKGLWGVEVNRERVWGTEVSTPK